MVNVLVETASSVPDQSVHRRPYWSLRHTCQSLLRGVRKGLNPLLPDKTSRLLTKADEWTCRPEAHQEEAAAAGSVGDAALPVSSPSVNRFLGLGVSLAKDRLLYRRFWQSLSTCWQITLRTSSSNREVDVRCEMSTRGKVSSDRDTHEGILPWSAFRTTAEDRE